MTRKQAFSAARLALAGVLALGLAAPAFAQTTSTVGGNLGSFIQQLVDLNTRERPQGHRHRVPVLLLLDEFARLGHAETVAKAFAFVAGYGLRLLPVLQSPAQLRAQYGPDLAEEIIANCGAEVAFAPKELKLAQELSERLGAYTYRGQSLSGPTLLGKGSRSLTESDQRRPLMLPQELIQMPKDQLIILRAGLPPIRARKIVYWREAAFARRVLPPPRVEARATPELAEPDEIASPFPAAPDPLALRLLVPILEAEGLAPLPPEGATPAEVEAWVDRFIDASARENRHGR